MREGWGTGTPCAGGEGRLQLASWLVMQACMPTCCPRSCCHNLAAGVPQVSLTGAADGMTIKINSIDGNDNGARRGHVEAPAEYGLVLVRSMVQHPWPQLVPRQWAPT